MDKKKVDHLKEIEDDFFELTDVNPTEFQLSLCEINGTVFCTINGTTLSTLLCHQRNLPFYFFTNIK